MKESEWWSVYRGYRSADYTFCDAINRKEIDARATSNKLALPYIIYVLYSQWWKLVHSEDAASRLLAYMTPRMQEYASVIGTYDTTFGAGYRWSR